MGGQQKHSDGTIRTPEWIKSKWPFYKDMITISCISISIADIVLELCYQFLNADFEARKSNCEAHWCVFYSHTCWKDEFIVGFGLLNGFLLSMTRSILLKLACFKEKEVKHTKAFPEAHNLSLHNFPALTHEQLSSLAIWTQHVLFLRLYTVGCLGQIMEKCFICVITHRIASK